MNKNFEWDDHYYYADEYLIVLRPVFSKFWMPKDSDLLHYTATFLKLGVKKFKEHSQPAYFPFTSSIKLEICNFELAKKQALRVLEDRLFEAEFLVE